jgi:hypothetical protein
VDAQRRAVQTARARFVLEAAREKEGQGSFYPETFRVAVQREASARPVDYHPLPDRYAGMVSREADRIRLQPALAEEIDYWEIDPDWDGDVFQSRTQAARPWRKGEIISELVLPDQVGQVCVRLVSVGGEYYQVSGALK